MKPNNLLGPDKMRKTTQDEVRKEAAMGGIGGGVKETPSNALYGSAAAAAAAVRRRWGGGTAG